MGPLFRVTLSRS